MTAMLALVTDGFGGRGGMAQYNRDVLTAFAGDGRLSSLIVLQRYAPDPHRLPNPSIDLAPFRSGRISYAVHALGTALRRPVDVVFCGHLYMAPLAVLIARVKGARLIVQMHGIEAWRRPTKVRRAAVEASNLVLCVSRHTRSRVLAWAAIAPERVLVLPNTVGDAFSPGEGSSLRAALGLEGKRVLLTVGRMDGRESYKGHDRVIAAIPDLIADGHDVVYVILGEGSDRPRLEALARELGTAGRIRFMGSVTPETLVEAYRMADLFVMPSTGEGFGIAFLEALACGTPALGLDAGGARDPLADGALGSAIGEDDLRDALTRALSGPAPDRQTLAAKVRARFGQDVFAARARAVLDRLAEAA